MEEEAQNGAGIGVVSLHRFSGPHFLLYNILYWMPNNQSSARPATPIFFFSFPHNVESGTMSASNSSGCTISPTGVK